jgi:imidazolonepropionase-like amidohydrolase
LENEVRNMQKEKIAIKGGTLIDGTGRKPLEDAIVIIEGPKITEIGRKDSVEIPKTHNVIDASGLTIVPGLMDCHVHLTGIKGTDPLRWVVENRYLRAMRAVADAWKILDYGFTSIRDLSENGLYLKKAIEEGSIVGPRIVAYGRGLGRTGGHGDLRRDIYDMPAAFVKEIHPFCIQCNGVDEIRKEARALVGRGADGFKIFVTGGGTWEKDREKDLHYTKDEVKAVVEEARMVGLKVAAHAECLEGAKVAVEAGVDTLEHGDVLNEEVCKEMVRKNIILVPTLSVYYVGPWAVEEPEIPLRSFKIAHATGVKIALGSDPFSDGITPFGKYNIGEIKRLVDAGLSPMEAIVSATKTSAEAMGIEEKVGTLEKGKSADILLIEGNPLDDITVFLDKGNIRTIMKEGTVVRGKI